MNAPCSRKHAKHCSPWHRWCVTEYRTARLAAERAHDVQYGGTTTEAAEHRGEMPTLRTWLIGVRGTGARHQEVAA